MPYNDTIKNKPLAAMRRAKFPADSENVLENLVWSKMAKLQAEKGKMTVK